MLILGIETSCDETAASIIEVNQNKTKVLSNIISSQISIHKKYGGVVPEVAAREHILNILPVINEALAKAKIKKSEASKKLAGIAVTIGPGLVTSLMIGVETAKTLSYAWKIPIIPVNHIEGHIYANWINNQKIDFPAVILTVSGGHNMLIYMKDHLHYKLIGDTRDDAAGEAFDKAAKLLKLGYPGGSIISKQAELYQKKIDKQKIVNEIKLPRPMISGQNFDFSFSGLKTALLYQVQADKNWKKKIPAYCHEFQSAIVDVLVSKTIRAGKKMKAKTIILAGGVSANTALRIKLADKVAKELPEANFSLPELAYTTDNAVMIAMAGYFKLKQEKTNWQELKTDPNLPLQ
ncbi:MAG: tRNA (adenosine(37)-N6)-threonylcarbamoyltransferase complex transferase subunit TsaD [bacterium]